MAQAGNKLLEYFRRGRWLRMALFYVRHPARLGRLSQRVRSYMSKEGLHEIGSLLQLLWFYVTDIAQGKYKDYNRRNLLWVVAALIYLVSPIDFIPDILPGGLVDDVGILLYVVNSVRDELARYKQNRHRNDK